MLRRIAWVVGAVALSGCALVSGLDKVGVGGSNDGGAVDGTVNGDSGEPKKDGGGGYEGGYEGGGGNAVACGASSCSGTQPVCCIDAGASQGSCVSSTSACTANAIRCDDPSDCDMDEVCCLSPQDAGGYRSSCSGSCSSGVVVCNPQEANACSGGKSCVTSGMFPLLHVCQ